MISDEEQCSLDVEIQSLKAIFAEELEVNRAEDDGGTVQSLVLQMSPESSKGEKLQFVCFEIVLEIPPEYPQAIPKITLRNVRGLSEEAQARTKEYMVNRAEELSGNAMLFELIQVAKEQLTSENTPSVPCSICLFNFDAEDSFSRTPCFHFFHTHCLAKHVQHTFAQKDLSEDKAANTETSKENQLDVLCPVCRLAIPFKESDPEQFPIPRESLKEQEEIVITPELREMQQEMAALYSKQLAKGSIIDLEAEKNKFFIEISNTPDIPVLSSASLSPSQGKPTNDTQSASDGAASKSNASEHMRKYFDGTSRKQPGVASNTSRTYDKKPVKSQFRKSFPKTENSEINRWEEKEEPEIERPRRTQPYKQYHRKDTHKSNDKTDVEGGTRLSGDDQSCVDVADEAAKRENYQQKNRRRQPFVDRKSKPNKVISNDNEESHKSNNDGDAEETNEGCEGFSEDLSMSNNLNARTEYRVLKKKKPRRLPKNYQVSGSNQEASVTDGDVPTSADTQGEETELRSQNSNGKFQSAGNQLQDSQLNRKNNSGTTENEQMGPPKGYRQNVYNRYSKRYYSEKPLNHSANLTENRATVKDKTEDSTCAENVDEQSLESSVNSVRNVTNRYRGSNNKSKNFIYGKNRVRNARYTEPVDGSVDTFNNDSVENTENCEESADFPKSHATRRSYQSGPFNKPREKFGSRKVNTQYGTGQNSSELNTNVESDGNNYRNRSVENWSSQSQRGNLRFQKSYSNESETSESQKDTDVSRDSFSEQTGFNRQQYRNNHNYSRRQQNSYADQNMRDRNRNSHRNSEANAGSEDNQSNQDSSRQYSRDNYRNTPRRRPNYGNNREQNEFEQADGAAVTTPQEKTGISQSNYSDTHRDYQSNRDRYDPRNNRRDNKSTNYAWKDKNRYVKYHGQQSHTSSLSPGKPEVTAASSRPDPTLLRQSIKPFTSMYNSATPDAQPVVCIPPPF